MKPLQTRRFYKKVFFFLLITLIGNSYLATAQSKFKREASERINWTPPEGAQQGAEASAQIKIIYDAFFGDPTRNHLAGNFKLGSYVIYNGQKIAVSSLPASVVSQIKFSSPDIAYDIYNSQNQLVCTVTDANVLSNDMASSPAWGKLFPGLTAEQAKDLYRAGFSIKNIRLTQVRVQLPNLSAYASGSSPSNPGSPSNPQTQQYETVGYRKLGDTIWIQHSNGIIERYLVCGASNQGGSSTSGTTTTTPNGPINNKCIQPSVRLKTAPYCIDVQWTACPNFGKGFGAEILPEVQSVFIQYRTLGSGNWITVKAPGGCMLPSSGYTIRELDPCTKYEFKVQYACQDGTMSESTESILVSTECPRPFNLRTTDIGTNRAKLSFFRNTNTMGIYSATGACTISNLESYLVAYSSDGMNWKEFTYTSGGMELNNLEADKNYQVKVAIRFPNGKLGPFSDVLRFRTTK